MELLRKESKEDSARTMQNYKQGGRATKTDPAELHKGEAVVRKVSWKKSRKMAR